MDPFSYLPVLTSIVLALGVARILTDVGGLLQARKRGCIDTRRVGR